MEVQRVSSSQRQKHATSRLCESRTANRKRLEFHLEFNEKIKDNVESLIKFRAINFNFFKENIYLNCGFLQLEK